MHCFYYVTARLAELTFAFSFCVFYSVVCRTRYKTRPGLAYHYSHSHCGNGGPPPPCSAGGSTGATGHRTDTSPGLADSQSPSSDANSSSRFSLQPGPRVDAVDQPPVVPQMAASSNTITLSAQQNPATSADDPLAGLRKFQDSFLTFLKNPGSGTHREQFMNFFDRSSHALFFFLPLFS